MAHTARVRSSELMRDLETRSSPRPPALESSDRGMGRPSRGGTSPSPVTHSNEDGKTEAKSILHTISHFALVLGVKSVFHIGLLPNNVLRTVHPAFNFTLARWVAGLGIAVERPAPSQAGSAWPSQVTAATRASTESTKNISSSSLKRTRCVHGAEPGRSAGVCSAEPLIADPAGSSTTLTVRADSR